MTPQRPDAETIFHVLQRVADVAGDPTSLIYARLFATHPELEPLFAMDRDGGVRASMVQTSIECILDHVGPDLTATNVISAARLHHQGYGVPDGLFDAYWAAMTEAFQDILTNEWTPDIDRAWRTLMAAFTAVT
ncbi:MAG: globin [Alphaproteobacteria bacterium]|nr:globin [Alphaproteobacteria bacterium]